MLQKHLSLVVLVILAGCFVSCQTQRPSGWEMWGDPVEPGELPKVSFYESVNDYHVFALETYKELLRSNTGENVIYSPYALALCLEILRFGVQGEAAQKIEQCLRLPEDFNIDSTHPPLFPYTPPPKQTKPAFAYPPIFLSKHSIWFSENLHVREEYKSHTKNFDGH